LSALIELYPTLSEADQYAFCARIMDLTYKSISTDVHKQADTLFWEIFSSVRIGWLDSDYNEAKKQLQIVTQLNEKMYADGLSDLAFYTMTKEAVEERLTGMHCSR
jgi:hypothetical protein